MIALAAPWLASWQGGTGRRLRTMWGEWPARPWRGSRVCGPVTFRKNCWPACSSCTWGSRSTSRSCSQTRSSSQAGAFGATFGCCRGPPAGPWCVHTASGQGAQGAGAPQATGSRRRRPFCAGPWRRSRSARSRGAARWSPRRHGCSPAWRRSKSFWAPPCARICVPACRWTPPAQPPPPEVACRALHAAVGPAGGARRWDLQAANGGGESGGGGCPAAAPATATCNATHWLSTQRSQLAAAAR
jgi:hypothetical protein